MANITRYLQDIKSAIYGYQVRDSIHDAIDIINKVGEKQIDIGTAISAGDPKGSYYENSLYINTNTWKLLKCNGTTWVEVGSIRGATGNGISSITGPVTVGLVDTYTINYDDGTSKTFDVTNGANGEDGDDGIGISSISKTGTSGLVDTYTITYTDGTTTTFSVTNGSNGIDGADGQNGNVWGTGTALTGTGTRLTGYPGVVGDCYLNTESNNVYQCTASGTASTAEWNYITNIKGASGTGSGDMQSDTYAATAKSQGLSNVVDAALTLYGLTTSLAELNYIHGLTSDVQTQLNDKISNPTVATGANKVPVSNGSGGITWENMSSGGAIDDSAISSSTTWSSNKINNEIPTALSDLTDDSTHRLVTDSEKSGWDSKADTSDIPTTLSELSDDSTHRLVTDAEKSGWDAKVDSSSLDEWTEESTLASGNTVTFTGLNDAYGYKLFAVDNPKPIAFTDCAMTGSGTSMQLVYTVSGSNLQVGVSKFKLRIIK